MESRKGTELLASKKQTILVIGPSGSGKTSLVGEGLNRKVMQDAYVFDTDYRLNSLLIRYGKEFLEHITFDQYRESGCLPGAGYAAVQAKKQSLFTAVRSKGTVPTTVVVDSGTFLAALIMQETLTLDGKKPDSTPGLNHYGTATAKFLNFVSDMTAGPWNFIMTVHDDIVKDEITGAVKYGIALTRKLRGQVPGYFNEVWETEVKKAGKSVAYEVHPKFNGGYATRTCIPSLSAIESHGSLWDKIEKWLELLATQSVMSK